MFDAKVIVAKPLINVNYHVKHSGSTIFIGFILKMGLAILKMWKWIIASSFEYSVNFNAGLE